MTPGAVVAISSHVMRGSVGNRAIVFALETLGLPVWAVNTVSLPFHPGHGRSTRVEPDPERLAAQLGELLASPFLGEVGAVLTGYMASPAQVEIVAGFVSGLRARRPELVHLCDPVIGDHGGLYVSEAVAGAIRDRLLPLADIATPNFFELGWLTGGALPADPRQAIAAARRLGPAEIVVTSFAGEQSDEISNLLIATDKLLMAGHRRLANPPHGTGDLFSALYLVQRMLGADLLQSLYRATAGVYAMIEKAVEIGSDELPLARNRESLLEPQVRIRMFESEERRV